MKKIKLFSILALAFFLITPIAFAQNDNQPNDGDDEGVRILNYYKDCVVEIETTLGVVIGMGNASGGSGVSGAEAYGWPAIKAHLASGGRWFIDDGNKLYRERVSRHSIEITLGDNETVKFGGSGVFIDGLGNVLTAAHVVRILNDELDAGFMGKIKISSYSYFVICHGRQKKYPALFRGADHTVDAGILQATGAKSEDYRVANIGDSNSVQGGERVYALGFPYGLPPTLSSGIVSNTHVYLEPSMNYIEDFIQTDAPINPGNSGGPLINSRGELIAINTAGYRGADGLGFAVPMHIIDLDKLKSGDVVMNWFGLEAMLGYFARTGDPGDPGFQDIKRFNEETGIEDLKSLILLANLTNEKRVENGDNQNVWAVVNSIDEAKDDDGNISPARAAGFKKGDLIVKVNGRIIRGGMDVRLAVRSIRPSVPFEIEFIRAHNGKAEPHKVTVELKKKKNNKK